MSTSIFRATNFILKLHAACLANRSPAVRYFPMNDGVFMDSVDWEPLALTLTSALRSLSIAFMLEPEAKHRFMVRGGIAFGQVTDDLPDGGNRALGQAANTTYRQQIVLGEALSDAHLVEELAPPFGLAVHPSARAEGVPTDQYGFFRWFLNGDVVEPFIVDGLREVLEIHLGSRPYNSALNHLGLALLTLSR